MGGHFPPESNDDSLPWLLYKSFFYGGKKRIGKSAVLKYSTNHMGSGGRVVGGLRKMGQDTELSYGESKMEVMNSTAGHS